MADVDVMTKQDLDALWAKMKDWFVKAPISAVTANTVAVFDGTTGKVIKSSGVVLGTAASRDVGAVTSGNVGLVTGDAVNTAINAALTAAMKIEGETTTAISDGSTTNPITIGGESVSAYKGMVVFYGKKEFVWVGTNWKELGDEGSFALKTTTVTGTGYLTGGGALSANQTLDISQTVKGYIDTAYTHATDASRLTTVQTSGFYKFATTAEGHIASVTAVSASDLNSIYGFTISGTASQTYNLATIASNASNGATAYRWGNHANAGYALASNLGTASTHAHGDYVTAIGTSGNTLTWSKGGTAQTAITVPYATSAGSATKATQDGDGNTISSTYLKLSGGTMANTNVVTNLNADLLDGQHGSYYATASSVTTLQGYFTNGIANSASELSRYGEIYVDEGYRGKYKKIGSASLTARWGKCSILLQYKTTFCTGANVAEFGFLFFEATQVSVSGNASVKTFKLIGDNSSNKFYVTEKVTASATSIKLYIKVDRTYDRVQFVNVTSESFTTAIDDAWLSSLPEDVSIIEPSYSGNVAYASRASRLTNTSAIGSSTKPVYFTANGVPAECSASLDSFVKYDGGAAEQTIKSSIASLSKGVINLWRNSGDHYTFLGFSNGTTETYLGGIGFKSQSDHNLYRKDGGNYYKIWDENNDGADSGLNADLLDGHHYSEINDAIGVLTNSVGQVSSMAQDNASNITLLDGRASDLESCFTNGVANSAAKLSTVSKTLFGNTYWTSGGVPTSIGTSSSPAALNYVTNIDSIAYFDRTNSRLGISTSSPSYKLHVTGDIYAQEGWLRTSGSNGSANGWQSQDYGGGWYCDDYTYVKTYGNRSIYTAADVLAGGNIVGTKGVASQGIANLSVAALSGSNFVTQVKIGSTAYNPSDGVVSLPAYPTVPTALSGFTNDVGYITNVTGNQITNALGYVPAKNQASTETVTGNIYDAGNKAEVYDVWTPTGTTATFKLPYDPAHDIVNYVLVVNNLSSDITVSFVPQVGTAHIIAPNNSLVVPAGKAIEVSYLTQLIGSVETVVLSWSSAFNQYTIQ